MRREIASLLSCYHSVFGTTLASLSPVQFFVGSSRNSLTSNTMLPFVQSSTQTATANSSNINSPRSSHDCAPIRHTISLNVTPEPSESKPDPGRAEGYGKAIQACAQTGEGFRIAATLWQALIREHEQSGNDIKALRACDSWVRSLENRRDLMIDDLLVVAKLVQGSFQFKIENFAQALRAYHQAYTLAEAGAAGAAACDKARVEYATLLCYFGMFDDAAPLLEEYYRPTDRALLRSEASLLALRGLCQFARGGELDESRGVKHLCAALRLESGEDSCAYTDRGETMRLLFAIRDHLREIEKSAELDILMRFISPKRRSAP